MTRCWGEKVTSGTLCTYKISIVLNFIVGYEPMKFFSLAGVMSYAHEIYILAGYGVWKTIPFLMHILDDIDLKVSLTLCNIQS